MYPDRDVFGTQTQTSDGDDVYTHPTMGSVTSGSYGPEPVSPPPPPPTTWDNN